MAYYISSNESELTGFRISRNSVIMDELNTTELSEHLLKDKPDVIRLKINAKDSSVFDTLNGWGMPFELYTVNTQLSLDIQSDHEYTKGVEAGMNIQPVNNDNHALFTKMVKSILRSKSWFMYDGSWYPLIFDKLKSSDLEHAYYSGFGLDEQRPAWLVYDGDNCVGAGMGTMEGESLHLILIGILEEYRSSGYSKSLYKMVFETCRQNKWSPAFGEIHFLNQHSLNSAVHVGFIPVRTFFNLTIYPMLSLSTSVPNEVIDVDEQTKKVFSEISSSRLHLLPGEDVQRIRRYQLGTHNGLAFEVEHHLNDERIVAVSYHKRRE